ncbi:MAG: DUF4884 domain-containing protein [Saprospiraceae bacterium]|nr:MAG: DUF4884 domain-containing protein [Saprospiraceae bacterium]
MKNQVCWVMLFSLFATGCFYGQPISKTPPANNNTYEVEYLFEHAGCKVYRFHDMGHYVYFTNCQGETVSYPDSTSIIQNRIEKN